MMTTDRAKTYTDAVTAIERAQYAVDHVDADSAMAKSLRDRAKTLLKGALVQLEAAEAVEGDA